MAGKITFKYSLWVTFYMQVYLKKNNIVNRFFHTHFTQYNKKLKIINKFVMGGKIQNIGFKVNNANM